MSSSPSQKQSKKASVSKNSKNNLRAKLLFVPKAIVVEVPQKTPIQLITDEVRAFDKTFDKSIIELMLSTVMDAKSPDKNAFIKRYSPLNVDFQMAWKNFKMFFGNDGRPRSWFYPEMGRVESRALILRSAYNELSLEQKEEMDSKEVKEMLENYEEQSKFFIVRHCVMRDDCFTVVRLERNVHPDGTTTVDYSRHWFGINKQNQVQLMDDSGTMGSLSPSSNTVEEYLRKNFASAGLNEVVVSNFASQSRNYCKC